MEAQRLELWPVGFSLGTETCVNSRPPGRGFDRPDRCCRGVGANLRAGGVLVRSTLDTDPNPAWIFLFEPQNLPGTRPRFGDFQ